jgi:Xaa-Pro aminopeptidase
LTTRIDAHKAVKSEEEIKMIRHAAKMQDTILETIKGHIKPDSYDYEVMSYGHYLGQLAGSETGYFLGSSAPPGQPTVIRRARARERSRTLPWQC